LKINFCISQIRLQSPREIAFRYSVGRGINIITIRAPYDFNDNDWHTVQIEINRQEARLTVDGLSAANPEDQTTFRHIRLSSNLTIGASVTNRNGFVGCIRAFQVNGELVDLLTPALRGLYGVSPGCFGKCQSNPCLNGGRCNERWSTYDCDCTFTPFRGPICSTEIGTRLEANTMIKYTFPTEGKELFIL
jgi:contactin associated protein-like 2